MEKEEENLDNLKKETEQIEINKKKSDSKDYGSDKIRVLEGLEGVRIRPSMYIGDVSIGGFHHLAYEIIDNSIDEALGGYCNNIEITINKNNEITIEDNGRGIPTDIHPVKKLPTLEIIFTSLHSGGKFDKNSYKVSGGLHGVGIAVVNALSENTKVTISRNGKEFVQEFSRGKKISDIIESPLIENSDKTGTKVSFIPDKEIFRSLDFGTELFDRERIIARLQNMAYLNPKLKITLRDVRGEEPFERVFYSENGLEDFIKYLNTGKKPLHEKIIMFNGQVEDVQISIALQYCENSYLENLISFVNNIYTENGGTHLTGLKNSLTRTINNAAKEKTSKKQDEGYKGSDVREGLTAIVSVKVPEPQFEGQTKGKLGNSEVQTYVSEFFYSEFSKYLEENPQMTKLILGKVEMALKGRLASIKARDLVRRKGPLDGMRLPGKLADCSSKNPKDCEIFIVEGDSAGGSAKEGRDRNTQAILPLRGKVINVEKAPLHKMLENNEIQALITAIGIGISTGDSSEDEEEELVKSEPEQAVETNGKRKKNQKEDDKNLEINLDNLRYDKIIILTDADVDGEHIKTLLLTFFFRFMRELIKLGHVYVAVPPIYKFSYKKHEEYYYEETALTKDIGEFCKKFNIPDPKSVSIQRYKGLGEMNPDQLAETTMDPNSRRLIRVNFEDFISSDIMFSKLMGTDVAPRKEYIMEHYNEVMNIDI